MEAKMVGDQSLAFNRFGYVRLLLRVCKTSGGDILPGSMNSLAKIMLILIGLSLADPVLSAPSATATTHPSPNAVVQYLNQTIDWYRHVQSLEQSSGDAQEMLVRATLLQNARQVVQLAF